MKHALRKPIPITCPSLAASVGVNVVTASSLRAPAETVSFQTTVFGVSV